MSDRVVVVREPLKVVRVTRRPMRVVVRTPGPQGIPGVVGGTWKREVPVGAIDGTNLVFTAYEPIAANSSVVYLNGLALTEGEDYTQTGPSQVTMEPPAPDTGDRLLILYSQT